MATKKQSTEVVPAREYRVMTMDPDRMARVIAANMGPGFKLFDLPQITVPTGGAEFWTVSGPEGPEPRREIQGVILWQNEDRQYWERGLDEGDERTPPDCYSADLIVGRGTPGGRCAECPFAEFGSAKPRPDGSSRRGQACHQRRKMLLMMPEAMMPVVVSAPPTSLRSVKTYMSDLTSIHGQIYNEVVTAFTLKGEKRGANDVAIVEARKVADVGPEQLEAMQRIADQFAHLLSSESGRAAPDEAA